MSARSRPCLLVAIGLLFVLGLAALPSVDQQPGGKVVTEGLARRSESGSVLDADDGDTTNPPTELDIGDDARGDDTATTPTTAGNHGDNDSTTSTMLPVHTTTTVTIKPRVRRTDFSGPPVDSVTAQINASHTSAHDDPALPSDLRLLWRRELNAHTSYPLIVGDRVFTVGSPFSPLVNPPIRLYAFDRLTGEDAWPSIEIGGSQFTASLAYDAGRLFVLNYDGLMRAIDPATGEVLWSNADLGTSTSAAPTAKDGRVVVNAAHLVSVLRQSDGALLWSRSVDGVGRSAPIVTNNAVYVVLGNLQVYKLSVDSGEIIWRVSQPGISSGSRAAVLYRGRLYARVADTEYSYRMVVLDAATGEVVGEGTSRLQPAFHDGIGVFVEPDYSIRGVDLDTGAQLWHYAANTSTPPVIVNDSVFCASDDFHLARVDLYTGALRWVGDEVPLDGYPGENSEAWMQGGIAEGRGVVAIPTGGGIAVYG